MIVVHTTNVNTALRWGVDQFQQAEQNPRNVVSPRGSRTVEFPCPVTTVYQNPTERVLFSPTRDANPFFHFFEALWMLAGCNDVAFVSGLNRQMAVYSDDGTRLWGAYGWRWRSFFQVDQIKALVELLGRDPASRRGVIAMWSPMGDGCVSAHVHPNADGVYRLEGGPSGKDVPCNTHLYFKLRHGKLNLTVCSRSNDMLWGAYGANAVHMSMLQEYVADKLGVEVGVMRQVSDSLHVYLDDQSAKLWTRLKHADKELSVNPYWEEHRPSPEMRPFPLGAASTFWDIDLTIFISRANKGWEVKRDDYDTPFFRGVVVPLWNGWVHRSVAETALCAAPDWKKAALEWLMRRQK